MAPRLPSFPTSAVGSFDYGLANDRWTWSAGIYTVRGLDPATEATTEAFFAGIHVDDREQVRATLEEAGERGLPFACRYRVVRAGRTPASVLMVGDASTDGSGAVTTLHGYAIDLTDVLESEASTAVERSARHRAAIEQVKGALMHTYGIAQDEAFDVLRSYSNTLNLRLATLAELVAQAMSAPTAGRPEGRRIGGRTLLDLIASAGGSERSPADGSTSGAEGAPQAGGMGRQAAHE